MNTNTSHEEVRYKSAAHKLRFVQIMERLGKVYEEMKFDPEYAAALYILTADLSTWLSVQSYVSRDGIYFEKLLEEVHFSGGFSVLIMLAGNLFGQDVHVDPVELMRLDEGNFQVALTAIKLRRYSLRVEEREP